LPNVADADIIGAFLSRTTYESLVHKLGRKGPRTTKELLNIATKGTPDHFEKLLKGSCSNHAFLIKHMYKDCALMKRFLSGGSKKGDPRRKPELEADNAKEKDGGFPAIDGYLMIFGGTVAYDSKRRQKLARREVYRVGLATPSFLRWSRSAITFDQSDYPESIPQPSRYPLVVDPIISTK
jgi:hypothetical protein